MNTNKNTKKLDIDREFDQVVTRLITFSENRSIAGYFIMAIYKTEDGKNSAIHYTYNADDWVKLLGFMSSITAEVQLTVVAALAKAAGDMPQLKSDPQPNSSSSSKLQ